ncbi:hypothetical protein G6L37_34870 [Agrobacterium rubi]|nr:hypothetical protein [Agrobacterium rubi]NTF23752.1 hypothetical protein [Agrobacterium rubi]
MEILQGLTEAEWAIVRAREPFFHQGSYDLDEIAVVMDILTDRIQPFASYVLNRVFVWLEGDGRWAGDDVIAAEWREIEGGRSCVLTRKADGATWTVDLRPKRQAPETTQITISVYELGTGTTQIARGDLSNGGKDSIGMRIREGAVEGLMHLSAFEDLCAFSEAIRGSMPRVLIDLPEDTDFHSFLPMVRVVHAATIDEDVLRADGGLPGRLCKARQAHVTSLACASVGAWMRDRLLPLSEGLRSAGAGWSEGVMVYNDGDYSCASVDFADGAKGYFSDDGGSPFEYHSFVARLGIGETSLETLSVYALRSADIPSQVALIVADEVAPDFIYDFAAWKPSFPGGRNGWTAMSLLFWQFATDSQQALEEGSIEVGGRWFYDKSDFAT